MADRPYRGKRAFDLVVLALLAIPALTLGITCAIAVRMGRDGPVFFRQERVGADGQAFHVLKFRTMVHSDSNPLFPDPARITTVGRVLRRLSLDELPQLLNVLIGQMSIVGPRPTLAYQVQRYTAEQRRRLCVRPGVTGLAQVRGRNSLQWAERIALDLDYLDRQSARYDLYVLLLSVRVVLGGDVGGHPTDDPLARPE